MKEVRFIQDRFITSKKTRTGDDISRVFARLVLQGKLSAAIKFLDKESSSGLLDLSPEILEGLKEKHPPASEIEDECLLNGPVDQVPPNIFYRSFENQRLSRSVGNGRGTVFENSMLEEF